MTNENLEKSVQLSNAAAAAENDPHAGHDHATGKGHEDEQESVHVTEKSKNSNGSDISGLLSQAMGSLGSELGLSDANTQKLMSMMGLGNAVQMMEMFGGILNKLNDKENGGAHANHEAGEISHAELSNLQPQNVGTQQQSQDMHLGA